MDIDTVSQRIESFNFKIKKGVALATPSYFTIDLVNDEKFMLKSYFLVVVFSIGRILCIFHKVTELLKIQSTYFGTRHVLNCTQRKSICEEVGFENVLFERWTRFILMVNYFPKFYNFPSARTNVQLISIIFNHFRPPTLTHIPCWQSVFLFVCSFCFICIQPNYFLF